jgi:hypothetical protein
MLTALSSVITGVCAMCTAGAIIKAEKPLGSDTGWLEGEIAVGLGSVTLLGVLAGLVFIWPICLVMASTGLRLMIKWPWVGRRAAWMAIGGTIGAIVMVILIPVVLPTNDDAPFGWIALFGTGCGALTATLCHRLLRVSQAD